MAYGIPGFAHPAVLSRTRQLIMDGIQECPEHNLACLAKVCYNSLVSAMSRVMFPV
ncbi:hypothetical protein DPMN_124262 [Dreissena polymorpha]|uniref:Uncharacterized protein n=1 Tax=Dreissena polymorpha TaxID=45954 RepID=A0A9D4JW06_DREPO|nr:hypothetical protein DPMN_124262 [Dreissena polymorpha]